MTLIADTLAISLYLVCAGYQGLFLLKKSSNAPKRPLLLGLAATAVTVHSFSAFSAISTSGGIDLGFFRVSSLIFWFICLISVINALRRPIDNMLVILFPLAAASIVISGFSAPTRPIPSDLASGLVSHILLSILAYSVLTIAALQAAILAIQERELKHRHTKGILDALPPLQTMEQMLFEIIWLGIILLSLSILSGAIFLDDIFAQHLAHKTILSIIAWGIFAVLLWGRHQLGWRGRTAIRGTLGGFVVLMLGYFGSKLVLELILT